MSTRVSPSSKGGEICKAATICFLTLEIAQVNESQYKALMYEVRTFSFLLILRSSMFSFQLYPLMYLRSFVKSLEWKEGPF